MDGLLPEKNTPILLGHRRRPGAPGFPPQRPDSEHAVFWLFSRLPIDVINARRGLGLEARALGVGQRRQAQDAMDLRRAIPWHGAVGNGKMKAPSAPD